jgi:hypothetical protein
MSPPKEVNGVNSVTEVIGAAVCTFVPVVTWEIVTVPRKGFVGVGAAVKDA